MSPRLLLLAALRHGDGTLSMARGGPNTATSSSFITIGDQPKLDVGGKRNPDGQGFEFSDFRLRRQAEYPW